jgi:hypothetical protein
MTSNAIPTPGPYTYTTSPFHSGNPATYNRVVKATGPYYATGSVTTPSAFYISGSAGTATVTLLNGGQIQLGASAASPSVIYEMSIYSVDAGTVYLLYR